MSNLHNGIIQQLADNLRITPRQVIEKVLLRVVKKVRAEFATRSLWERTMTEIIPFSDTLEVRVRQYERRETLPVNNLEEATRLYTKLLAWQNRQKQPTAPLRQAA